MEVYEYFAQLSAQAAAKREQLFTDIVQTLMAQEFASDKQKVEMAKILARQVSDIREQRRGLDKIDVESLVADSEIQQALIKARAEDVISQREAKTTLSATQERAATDRYTADLDFKTATLDAQNASRTAAREQAEVALTRAEPYVNTLPTKSLDTQLSESEVRDAIAGGVNTGLRESGLLRALAAADTPAGKAEVAQRIKSFVGRYVDNVATVRKGKTNSEYFAPSDRSKLVDSVSSLVLGSDSSLGSPDQEAEKSVKAAADAIPGSNVRDVGGYSQGVAALDLAKKETERFNRLLGREVTAADLDFDPNNPTLSAAEQYVLRAAYNRTLFDADDSNDLPSYEEFVSAWRKQPEVQSFVDTIRTRDDTSLRILHSGDRLEQRASLRDKEKQLQTRLDTMFGETDGRSNDERYEDVIRRARILYSKLYGGDRIKSGMEAAAIISKETAGMSPDEKREIIASMPGSDSRKEVMLKATMGEELSEAEFRKLHTRSPALDIGTEASAIGKLKASLPSELIDVNNNLLIRNDDGTMTEIPLEQASVVDLADSIIGGLGPDTDPKVAAKLRAQAKLLSELVKSPRLAYAASRQLGETLSTIGGEDFTYKEQTKNIKQEAKDQIKRTGSLPANWDEAIDEEKWQQLGREPRELDTTVITPTGTVPNIPAAPASPPAPFIPAPATPKPLERGTVVIEEAKPTARKKSPNSQSYSQAVAKRSLMSEKLAPDALRSASAMVKEKTGRTITANELITASEQLLSDFSPKQVKLLRDYARQVAELGKSDGLSGLEKIISPIQDPAGYAKAAEYLGMARLPEYQDINKRSRV